MSKFLSDLKIGDSGTVIKVHGEGAVRRRLFDMGVTPGAEIYFRKKAPLGEPIDITLRGYELTLRKAEASCVEVAQKRI
jgi:Fe2+ transport system protein FeoA